MGFSCRIGTFCEIRDFFIDFRDFEGPDLPDTFYGCPLPAAGGPVGPVPSGVHSGVVYDHSL